MLGIWLFHTNGHFQGQNSGHGRERIRGEGGRGRRRERARKGERDPVTSFTSVVTVCLHLDLRASTNSLTSRQRGKGSHFWASTGAKFTQSHVVREEHRDVFLFIWESPQEPRAEEGSTTNCLHIIAKPTRNVWMAGQWVSKRKLYILGTLLRDINMGV